MTPTLAHKDLYERMNFLYQAAHLSVASNPHCSLVSNDCCQQLMAISRRAVLKLDPTMKRSVCKRCNALLVPGITSTVRIIHKKQNVRLVVRCLQCKMIKRFQCQRGYKLWCERPQSTEQSEIDRPDDHGLDSHASEKPDDGAKM